MPISLNPSIHSLILRYNQFHTVDASFNFYPELELVDLSHNQLVSVPDRAFKAQGRLRDLRLHNNQLSQLSATTFVGLRQLESLDLRHNLLEAVPAAAFEELASLELLDLGHNLIREIDEDAFKGLENGLKVLRLEGNGLTAVPTAALGRLSGLLELTLSRNQLISLTDKSFSGLVSLAFLDLSGNQLERLHERSFLGLDSLAVLRLHDNSLHELSGPVLRPLSASLAELWLGQNRFSVVSRDWLVDVPRLQRLDLSNCPQLRSIAAEAFSPNLELEQVTIAANPLLAHIHEAAFLGLTSVQRLDLSNNALEAVPPSLVPWERLVHLQVSGNPLLCSCAANYFLKEVVIRTALNSSEGVRVVRCWNPVHLRDRDLARLDLRCSDEAAAAAAAGRLSEAARLSTVAGIVTAATVVVLVILVLLVRCLRPAPCLPGGRQKAGQLPAKDILQYEAAGSEPRYVSPRYAPPVHPPSFQHRTAAAATAERPYLVNIVTNPYEEGRQGGRKQNNGSEGGSFTPAPAFYYYTADRRTAAAFTGDRALPPALSMADGALREPLYYAVSSAGSQNNGSDQPTATLLKIDTNNYHYADRESLY
jgi:Leucine-rich repeat (LRR) protein